MHLPTLLHATVRISHLVDLASQKALTKAELAELRSNAEILGTWSPTDPAFAQASQVTMGLVSSGIFSSPSKPPTLPMQILSDCSFLTGYLDSRMSEFPPSPRPPLRRNFGWGSPTHPENKE